jgi:nucleoside-diphosphate-sugar epimerase
MRCLVTGVAGFIGSHLAERLLLRGDEVVGVDRFADYYPRAMKEKNLLTAHQSSRFSLVEADLARADLAGLVDGCEAIFHQAAQAGVRASWGASFADYVHDNVLGTQRLLEAAKAAGVRKVVYASSSSVYGETPDLPMRETSLPRPFSPYGVTKLAAEHLCELYRHNFGLPTASLRYFTVYGPRQRPDMAFHRFIMAILAGETIPMFGDGQQTREFTFVSDIVEANLLAMADDKQGVFNVGGGSRVTLQQVLATLGDVMGLDPTYFDGPSHVDRLGTVAGDVRHTVADTTRAREVLGFAPKVGLRDGLLAQVAWQRTLPQASTKGAV